MISRRASMILLDFFRLYPLPEKYDIRILIIPALLQIPARNAGFVDTLKFWYFWVVLDDNLKSRRDNHEDIGCSILALSSNCKPLGD
jgi:hypothetical protein